MVPTRRVLLELVQLQTDAAGEKKRQCQAGGQCRPPSLRNGSMNRRAGMRRHVPMDG
ncbi:MAG: hypothetical protein V2I40_16900 [Desulfobacteraceae bacterium]|nr:hypothetical protein [Desulfobacteraceae bacterium]